MESFVDYDQFVARLEQVETLYGFKYARQSSTKDFGINGKNNFFIPFIQVGWIASARRLPTSQPSVRR